MAQCLVLSVELQVVLWQGQRANGKGSGVTAGLRYLGLKATSQRADRCQT